MRKQKQAITDLAEVESILRLALVCRVAMAEAGVPYLVPVCFGHKDNRLYIHSAAEGKKIEMIRRNNYVCFEVETDVELVKAETACGYTMKYRSVIGFGKAHIVEDPEEKKEGLDIIMEHYSGSSEHEYAEKGFKLAAIIRIDIESMTGKRSKA